MALLMLALIVLLPVAALVAWRGFDGLYGQDAFAYFDYAVGPLRTALLRGQVLPPPPFFWPPGYPALVTLASLILGPGALAGQFVSMVMGGLVPLATALLALELWPGAIRRALLAGGFVAVCGQLWQSAAVIMSDTTGLALATLGIWAVAAYGRRRQSWWLVRAAALLGWATITRWIYGLVALVGVVCTTFLLTRPQPRGKQALHAVPAVAVGASVLAWVLVPVGMAGAGEAAPFLGTLETYGSETWSLANIGQREFLTTGHGFVHYSLPNGVYYAGAVAHPFMLTPLLGAFVLPGLVVLVRRRTWATIGLLVGWALSMYVFHAGSTWQNLRYVLAYLPPVAVVAAVGADALLARAGWVGRLAGVWLLAGAVWAAAGGVVLANQFIERKQADLATVRWVESQTPPDARLLTFGPTLNFRHYGQLEALELFELSPTQLHPLLRDGRPSYLLVDVANIEDQWAGRAPAEDYHWLRDGPGLTPLGTTQSLTLFRIGGT